MRQGASLNSSRRIYQNIKDFLKKFFIFLKKSCQVFEKLFHYKNKKSPRSPIGNMVISYLLTPIFREYFKDISQVMLIHFYTLIFFFYIKYNLGNKLYRTQFTTNLSDCFQNHLLTLCRRFLQPSNILSQQTLLNS